ncbi:MAG: PilZ domain-containing protein [Desulfobacterales bacterium]
MKSNIERRYHKRHRYEAIISHDISSNDTIHPGKMFNFSKGGLYFESDEAICPDEEVFVGLATEYGSGDHDTQLLFEVKIIWRQQLEDSPFNYGYGAKFLNSSDSLLESPGMAKLEQQASSGKEFMSETDARKYHRRVYNKPLNFIYKGMKFKGLVADISRGGAFIETGAKFSLSESIQLVLPGGKAGKKFLVKGWIVRISRRGVGVSFERRSGRERRNDLDRRTGSERRGRKRRKIDC